MDTNWIEKEIKQQLKDQYGIIEEELNRTSLTIIELTSDIIKAKLSEIKDLNDRIRSLEIDVENKEIMITDLQEEKQNLMDEIDDISYRNYK
jgi:hypothetical protein